MSAHFEFPGICWQKAWLTSLQPSQVLLKLRSEHSSSLQRKQNNWKRESCNLYQKPQWKRFTYCALQSQFRFHHQYSKKKKKKKKQSLFASVWSKFFHISTEVTASWSSPMNWSRKERWRSAREPWGWAPNRCAWVWLYRKCEYESSSMWDPKGC